MKNLAVIGYPVMHSLSPKMHNFISAELGLDYHYRHEEVSPENLGDLMARFRKEGICGFNVTAPHKLAVMEYLDEISADASELGAVNTVVCKDGRFVGYNTDGEGFYKALVYNGVEVEGKDILLLGAGGAAKPVSMYLSTQKPDSITIINRTKEKAEAIKDSIFGYSGFVAETEHKRDKYHIIINSTTLGMGENIGISPVSDYSIMDKDSCVVDMIYSPRETELLKNAKKIGAKTLNGLGMLAFQGMLAYERFTGVAVPDEFAGRIIHEVFGE